ncbi:hypothetical protein [Hydrogenophaga sp. OTU3427]|uniref:hypothetical protein n=1 Tax=Hydrogenophaga sp. OTU3427 TaxID=3043856 RepID=UPI00313E1432
MVELTPEGWQAVWSWVQERALDPEKQSEQEWRQHAQRSINLAAEDEPVKVGMRGAVSKSGHLEVLRLKPQWYRRNRRSSVVSPALLDALF